MTDIDRRIEGLLASIEADRERAKADLAIAQADLARIEAAAQADREAIRASLVETERMLKESIAVSEKRDKLYAELKKEVGGISNSNGEFAEEYFENIYCRDMTFAGMRFHEIIRRKRFDDRKRKDEFDIIMLNEENTLIVETKYKAKESDIDGVIKKAESFRYWYPEYKDHKIYLCLASLRFEDNIIGKARKKGIAIIQQLGDKTVVNDEHLKAY
jgi:NAD-specific glutamate dehydrogenase